VFFVVKPAVQPCVAFIIVAREYNDREIVDGLVENCVGLAGKENRNDSLNAGR